jgi:excisionase family DNA binding protein
MESEKLTCTIDEVTRMLGISRPLAYQMARTGKLPVIRLGRRILVSKKGIDRMLDVHDKF